MKPHELEALLAQTLEDRSLSRSEGKALRKVLAEADTDPALLAPYRAAAFSLAQRALTDTHSRAVLQWLENVVKLLTPRDADRSDAQSHAWFSPDDDCPRRIIELIERRHERIDICVFTITHDRIAAAIQRAHDRGAAVRLITDNDKADDLGSDIYRLRMAGVPVRLDKTRHHMHHKFAIFDRKTLVTGSFNWTRSAALHNEENLIVTSDPTLVRDFARVFDRLWDELG